MRIDIHAHCYPGRYLDALDRHGSSTAGTAVARGLAAGDEPAELAARFALMEQAGINLQVISVAPQMPYFTEKRHAIDTARMANDILAGLVARYPERFLAFAALPLPHVAPALDELVRCFDGLGMVGVAVTTTILGRSLADPSFAPLFAELDRRGAVLCLHPAGNAADSPHIRASNYTWALGAPLEDTLAILDLLRAGYIARYPNVRIIVPHLGGVAPFLVKRFDAFAPAFLPPGMDTLPSAALRALWYDTVNEHPPALRCACDTLGSDRLLLGTDYPYLRGERFIDAARYLEAIGLPAAEVEAIGGGNAQALLRLPVRR